MKAIILLSGGLDSTVLLAKVLSEKKECFCLSFDYGQKHKIELEAAKKIAHYYQVPHQILSIPIPPKKDCALTGETLPLQNRCIAEITCGKIPNTYVPARNTIFLSYAMSYAEVIEAQEIYLSANAMDGGYPDCLPSYVKAFQYVLNEGSKQAKDGHAPKLIAPFLHMRKEDIIALGICLNVPLDWTISCYSPNEGGVACLQCDSCLLRIDGFKKNNR